MSRYESSRFVKDPKTMNKEILKAACDKLGWKYRVQGEDLIVTDAKTKGKGLWRICFKSFRVNGDL